MLRVAFEEAAALGSPSVEELPSLLAPPSGAAAAASCAVLVSTPLLRAAGLHVAEVDLAVLTEVRARQTMHADRLG